MLTTIVYHGSQKKRNKSIPTNHRRSRNVDGKKEVIFNQMSFHASPEYWIALSYTYTPVIFSFDEHQIYYNVEVDLYENKKEIVIHGINSLEESLNRLYSKGGYISSFYQNDFFHTSGLGNLELITNKEILAVNITRIEDPVAQLQSLGIKFIFIDLSKRKNYHLRNYFKG